VTLDYQTEWVETLHGGWNIIAGPNKGRILHALATIRPDPRAHRADVFGSGECAARILTRLAAEASR
jgi:hypothetical protein